MTSTHDRQLVWLRTDLRIEDNSALLAACSRGPTLALFVISPEQWREHDEAASKVDFWLRSLAELQQQLAGLNIPLLVRQVTHWRDVPATLLELCGRLAIAAVHCNEEYGLNERRRDEAARQALEASGIGFNSYLDQSLFAPGSVLTRTGGYYQVFGQFRRACLERLRLGIPAAASTPRPQAPMELASDPVPEAVEGFAPPSAQLRQHWPAGASEAHRRLQAFTDDAIHDYHYARDLPARPGTSELSTYLNAGVISIRQCLHAALMSNQGELDSGSVGVTTWIGELLWREFYKHILAGYPRVSQHRAFRQHTEALPWRDAPDDFAAWQEGRTGIPIIDAAMRQLKALGWMHNRLRMISAMFLSKNLLIDWRLGERHFMQHLIDGELAANNGGWQWSASTGTDSVPYFRVFNPVSQSARFDPQGVFIKHWVPELRDLSPKTIHNPPRGQELFGALDYPPPLVDLGESRARALSAFKNLPRR
ncbi:deoxyribodipyrimidine photo-lyase [Pseudomonas sp. RIT-PI-S]|uniref:deoxyribodipyrimidine photo-lyase n=1 Tax=Pseudomonas sp. RIT-PI-S TaxID=3035295 RepID=UPI0021DA4E5C|nr:deoxyribodipyrimidine photo-lyase [Pseudomonas sp. RIT-PI-S]